METVNFTAKRFKTVGYTFVGKLYHCAVNHPSGLRLNKKANYLAAVQPAIRWYSRLQKNGAYPR
jgi:hypothetical protein